MSRRPPPEGADYKPSTRLKDSTREAYDTRPRFGLNIDSRSFSDSDSGISGSVETNRPLPSVSLGNQARDSEVVVLRPEESHGKTMARQDQMDMAAVVQMMMQMRQDERERG